MKASFNEGPNAQSAPAPARDGDLGAGRGRGNRRDVAMSMSRGMPAMRPCGQCGAWRDQTGGIWLARVGTGPRWDNTYYICMRTGTGCPGPDTGPCSTDSRRTHKHVWRGVRPRARAVYTAYDTTTSSHATHAPAAHIKRITQPASSACLWALVLSFARHPRPRPSGVGLPIGTVPSRAGGFLRRKAAHRATPP